MSFCIAISILKMEENKQHFQHIMLYCFKKGKHDWNTRKDLCSVQRGCCGWLNVSKVVCKVSCWDFSLEGAPWSGRPVQVNSDQVETLTENNQHSTTQEAANILKISKSVKLLVKMKNCVSYFIENNIRIFGQPNIAFFQLLVLNYLFLLLNVLIFVLYILELLLGA